jgi:hypothetical protein
VLLSFSLLLAVPVVAQNKVVVIPLLGSEQIEPWAPVAAVSPPSSSYSLGTNYIVDNETGLIWQQSDDNTLRTWEEAWNYCTGNDAGLPGTGWRLPANDELMSIVNYGVNNPAINGVVFPGTNGAFYWSATTSHYGNRAWLVDFFDGEVTNWGKINTCYVRCVRELPNRQNLFKNNNNGTVSDLATGLTWQRENDFYGTLTEATSYCQGLSLAGGGWRLPTIKELRSIVDDRVREPAIDGGFFPGTANFDYWSSTLIADGRDYAWCVDFLTGYAGPIIASENRPLRCVR